MLCSYKLLLCCTILGCKRRKWLQGHTPKDDAPLTDSDDSDAESAASLEALSDASADDGRAMDLDSKWRPVQLHTVAKAVRDSSKTVAQVEALSKLEPLVRCAARAACALRVGRCVA